MRSATLVLTFCSTIVVFGQETAPASGPASRPSGDDVASAPASRAESKPAPPDAASLLDAVAFRGLGPASCSGRIGDLAVDPRRRGTWYVAAASGGVWKTVNAGTTFEPIFDGQTSYSIGCLAVNPSRPDEVWVGT
ncbi:MAG TPA: hypothetical protein VEI02_16000, partial [Planctomycetota bacterium]|nr:hypothetical protein [Planctomycetota bacterium]